MSSVSADPPNTRRSMSAITCRATPCAAATRCGGLKFDGVPLAVAEAQRVGRVPFRLRDRQDGRRVKPTAQQDHRRLVRHDASNVSFAPPPRSVLPQAH